MGPINNQSQQQQGPPNVWATGGMMGMGYPPAMMGMMPMADPSMMGMNQGIGQGIGQVRIRQI